MTACWCTHATKEPSSETAVLSLSGQRRRYCRRRPQGIYHLVASYIQHAGCKLQNTTLFQYIATSKARSKVKWSTRHPIWVHSTRVHQRSLNMNNASRDSTKQAVAVYLQTLQVSTVLLSFGLVISYMCSRGCCFHDLHKQHHTIKPSQALLVNEISVWYVDHRNSKHAHILEFQISIYFIRKLHSCGWSLFPSVKMETSVAFPKLSHITNTKRTVRRATSASRMNHTNGDISSLTSRTSTALHAASKAEKKTFIHANFITRVCTKVPEEPYSLLPR